MTAAIERTLELDSSVEDVWRALTDPTEVAGWFGDSAEFSPTAGAGGWFGWEKHGRFSMQVEAFEPRKRFAWRWAREADKPLSEAASTLVEWTLTPREDGGTTLHLRETGFLDEKAFEDNSKGWTHELGDLADFLAKGVG